LLYVKINGMDITLLIFQLAVLLFSVMIHEVSHGAVALKLGDPTAKDAGRLTLNPIKHLDFFGSFLLPVLLFFVSAGTFVLGWAKPVPYNPYNLKNPKTGAGIIGVAGPLSNILVAIIFGIFIRILATFAVTPTIAALILLFNIIVFINILLAIFNLLPLPPLDGANVLFSVLPKKFEQVRHFLERYGFFLLILFIFFGFQLIIPIINTLFRLIVGSAAIF